MDESSGIPIATLVSISFVCTIIGFFLLTVLAAVGC